MSHEIFISYASKDKGTALKIVQHLEKLGLRCWIAPRDIPAGRSFAEDIGQAIKRSNLVLLVFSSNANHSKHIPNEIVLAGNYDRPVVPVRIEDVLPSGDLEYYLCRPQWFEAHNRPIEHFLDALGRSLKGEIRKADPRLARGVKPDNKKDNSRTDYTAESPKSMSRLTAVWPIWASGSAVVILVSAILMLIVRNHSESPVVYSENIAPLNSIQSNTMPVTIEVLRRKKLYGT